MKNIAVIGVGYVGLVTGTCLADLGHRVVCLDVNEERIANLNKGVLPIYEPGLEEVVRRNVNAGRLLFTTNYAEAVNGTSPDLAAEYVFIAVGTPDRGDGHADLSYLFKVIEDIAPHLSGYKVLVTKSTVPVGTGRKVQRMLHDLVPQLLGRRQLRWPGSHRPGICKFVSSIQVEKGSGYYR